MISFQKHAHVEQNLQPEAFGPTKTFLSETKPFARPILFQINRFPGTKPPHKQESVLFPGTAPAKDRHPKPKNESGEKKFPDSLLKYLAGGKYRKYP